MREPVVAASEVTKRFGSDAGVFDLNLEVPGGLIVGLIGPSGAGKTTIVRLMTGIIGPDSGTLRVLGISPMKFDPTTRARIGYMPQDAILYPELSLGQNLDFAASLYGMSYRRRSIVDRLIEFVELEGTMDRMPAEASGGEKRRVMLASTLIHEPDLIFLDEPTAGIDPVLRKKFWDRFGDLSESGRSLVVTTQYVGEAAYCDYVAVLREGRVILFDTPEGLRRVAFGGEQIDVTFAEAPDRSSVISLSELNDGKPMRWLDSRSVRITVEDAGAAGPALSRWADGRQLTLEKTEVFLPPFDDVFVELVSRSEEPHAA